MWKVREKNAFEKVPGARLYNQVVPQQELVSLSLLESVCQMGDSHMLFTHLALYFPWTEWNLLASQE